MFITEMITWLQHNGNIMMQLQWITIIREAFWDTQICTTLQIHHVMLSYLSRQSRNLCSSQYFATVVYCWYYLHVWEFQALMSLFFFLDCAQNQREEMVLVEGIWEFQVLINFFFFPGQCPKSEGRNGVGWKSLNIKIKADTWESTRKQ